MLKVFVKNMILLVSLVLIGGQHAAADKRLYQYDGKMPFVQMMLNMMSVMGILDRVPTNSAYGYSPFQRTPWSSSPWSQGATTGHSPAWGSPDWGVLPYESYASDSYRGYYPGNSGRYQSNWSSADLDGWVNESWESSSWNPDADLPVNKAPQQQPLPQPQAKPTVPLVQNFNYNVTEDTQRRGERSAAATKTKTSPLAKLVQPGVRNKAPVQKRRQAMPSANNSKYGIKQKPCVSEFCGLKRPSLNGLWVAQNGEMLGVKNKRYLWSDSSSRYLTGFLKVQNEYLLANVDGHDQKMRFKYKLAGNHLLTMQPDGKIREFVRMPSNQYYGRDLGQNVGRGVGLNNSGQRYYQ